MAGYINACGKTKPGPCRACSALTPAPRFRTLLAPLPPFQGKVLIGNFNDDVIAFSNKNMCSGVFEITARPYPI